MPTDDCLYLFPQGDRIYEVEARFPSEAECFAYLFKRRWPNGFHCAKCEGRSAKKLSNRLILQCATCRHQASVTAGTALHRSHLPLRVWLGAAYLLVAECGAPAARVKRLTGISSDKTVWEVLRRMRVAMAAENRQSHSGKVAFDCTRIEGVRDQQAQAVHLNSPHGPWVAWALELRESIGRRNRRLRRTPGALRLCRIIDGENFDSELDQVVGAETERFRNGSHQIGFRSYQIDFAEWLRDRYGSVDIRYLQSYADEYVFHWNLRRLKSVGPKFDLLVDHLLLSKNR